MACRTSRFFCFFRLWVSLLNIFSSLQNDLANFSSRCRFDSVHPLTYYSYVIHMHLDAVEMLINPAMDIKRRKVEYFHLTQTLPKPFINVARFETQHEEIYCPSLFLDSNEVPFHAYATGADKIGIVNLRTYQTLLLTFHDNEQFGSMVSVSFFLYSADSYLFSASSHPRLPLPSSPTWLASRAHGLRDSRIRQGLRN